MSQFSLYHNQTLKKRFDNGFSVAIRNKIAFIIGKQGLLLQKSFPMKILSYFLKAHPFLDLFLVMSLFSLLSCESKDKNVLAMIGAKTISTQDFINRYRSIREKMNLPDNGQIRNETFRNMINETLLIVEAETRGYHTDNLGQYESERIKIQELINAYLRSSVFNDIRIKEEELKSLFINLNSMVKARHLYADSKKRADSLYHQLMMGKSFEVLAKQLFNDPQLRDTGGLLGYFTIDEMDPGFEEAAFSLLIGQVSKPVRTAQGYSIIQVLDRITKPMLTESEYVKHRNKLETYWHYRLKKRAAQSFSDSVRNTLSISFNNPVLRELYKLLETNKSEFVSASIENIPKDNPIRDKQIVNSSLGDWTIDLLQEKAKFTSEKQRKWIGNCENLEDFIAGLIVRSHILSEAKKLKLDITTEYKAAVKQKFDDYLFLRMQNTISEDVVIPEDSLKTYYKKHKDRYVTPPRIHLSEIVLDSELKANEVKNLLLQNISFNNLAKVYSVRKWSAENSGEIGIYTEAELGIYADRLMMLEEGQWTGPVEMNNQYIYFKCLNKLPERHQSYEEALRLIQKDLKPIWLNQVKQTALREIRSSVELVTYPEKLKLIQMN